MSDNLGSISSISEILGKNDLSGSLDLGGVQCEQCISSSSSIDELNDKLDILEKVAGAASDQGLLASIQGIKDQISAGVSLTALKETSGIH